MNDEIINCYIVPITVIDNYRSTDKKKFLVQYFNFYILTIKIFKRIDACLEIDSCCHYKY